MGGAARFLGDVLDAEIVDGRETAAEQQIDEGLIPFGIERRLRRQGGAVDLAGGDGALLPGGARLRRRIAAADQEFPDGFRRPFEQGDGRLVRQAAGSDDQNALVERRDILATTSPSRRTRR